MRWSILSVALLMTACAPDPETLRLQQEATQVENDRLARNMEARLKATADAEAALTPAQRARRQVETDLLERALSGSPDYTAAVRRAAIAVIDADPPVPIPSQRQRTEPQQARDKRIAAEEARLSDEIEKRRRTRLAENEQRNKNARDQQAVATCQARGNQIDAAYYNPRSLLNLEGMAAGNQARNACLQAYQQTGILP